MLTAYRAALPGVALLCSLVAFILALCCLLAGTNPKTLSGMELYTLNTSKIATTVMRDLHIPQSNSSFNISTLLPRGDISSTLSNAGDSLSDLGENISSDAGNLVKDPKAALSNLKKNITQSVDKAKQEVKDAANKVEDTIKNATGQIVGAFINETIHSLNIHDFYVAHLLTYCEGNYTAKGKENITFCSNHKPNNKYNATGNGTLAKITKGDDNPLAIIASLHFPDPAEYAVKALTLLANIISAFYIVGIIALVCSLVSAGLMIPLYFAPPNPLGGGSKRTILRWASLATSAGAFFCLLLATSMVHFLVKNLCAFINAHPGAGVAAYPGTRFQGCSWAAVILIAIAMTLAIADMAIGLATRSARNRLEGAAGRKWFGSRRNKHQQQEQYEMDDE